MNHRCIDTLAGTVRAGRGGRTDSRMPIAHVGVVVAFVGWATGKTEAHKLDANLSTISVCSLANAGVKLVPDIVAGGGSLGGGTLVDVLLASVIRDRTG
jgi:hypothetical protein